MRKNREYIKKPIKHRRKRFNPAKILFLGYFFVVVIGAGLLMLPISQTGVYDIGLIDALFTATSAVSVTGLTTVTVSYAWSFFGWLIILCMVQVGALGFMSLTVVFFFLAHKKISLSHRLLISRAIDLHDVQGVVKLTLHVLVGTFFFQLLGALLLWFRFAPIYGLWEGLGMGAFHSITAFANAGFNLFGSYGLQVYREDVFITATIMTLTIIGGLGFFVWEDLWQSRFKFKKLHLHSKLVLSITLFLIIFGTTLFFIAERNNPYSLYDTSLPQALHISLFQSISPRSSGFTLVEQSHLMGLTQMLIMTLMLIGASAGSTGGGIRNVTVGILLIASFNFFRGRSRVSAFGRTVPAAQVHMAVTISFTVLFAAFFGTALISLMHGDIPFTAVLFEVISAIGTVGLSHGITAHLSPAAQLLLIVFMFFGRLGIIALGMMAFSNRNVVEKTKYPDSWIMMT